MANDVYLDDVCMALNQMVSDDVDYVLELISAMDSWRLKPMRQLIESCCDVMSKRNLSIEHTQQLHVFFS